MSSSPWTDRDDKDAEARLREQTLASDEVYRGRLLHIRRDRVRLPNGLESTREYIAHPGAVVIMAMLENGDVLFERQFRYPLRQTFLELPAGKIDPGETPEAAARRELREETGYQAANWRRLGVIHPCIGYSDESITVFQAEALDACSGQQLDAGEFLEVTRLSRATLRQKIISGEITDAKTLAALHLSSMLDRF
jgi:ADP-ribose pyrophosphatase